MLRPPIRLTRHVMTPDALRRRGGARWTDRATHRTRPTTPGASSTWCSITWRNRACTPSWGKAAIPADPPLTCCARWESSRRPKATVRFRTRCRPTSPTFGRRYSATADRLALPPRPLPYVDDATRTERGWDPHNRNVEAAGRWSQPTRLTGEE